MEVSYFNWGVTQPASGTDSSAGGATAERANFSELSIRKTVDKASPKLSVACADGTHIKEIIIEVCRAGGDKLKYLEYKLSNCIISSVSTVGGGGAEPTGSISFNYGKIQWTYTQQKRSDGSGGGNVAAAWDLQTNKMALEDANDSGWGLQLCPQVLNCRSLPVIEISFQGGAR